MIVFGGLTGDFLPARDIVYVALKDITAQSLVPAENDPSLSYSRPNFSLIQLLFALGIASCAICLFCSIVSHSCNTFSSSMALYNTFSVSRVITCVTVVFSVSGHAHCAV